MLADGATGTTLFDMGLVSGDAPEIWNVEAPDNIRALHRGFVEAGSDIILTNTFGANRDRLKLHSAQGRVVELNRAGAELACEVAAISERAVIIAGSMGPLGELFDPLGALTPESAEAAFTEQAEGLKAGGANLCWIETMSSIEEIQAAARGAINAGMDYTAAASFDTAGKTMMGVDPSELAAVFADLAIAPLAYGANCGVGASDLLVSLLGMDSEDGDNENGGIALIAKANCGIPQVHGDHVHYSGTPELMTDYAHLAIDCGARIIGGCCGTTADHIAAMRVAIDSHDMGPRPDQALIEARLGPLQAPPAAGGVSARRPRRRRRRARASA